MEYSAPAIPQQNGVVKRTFAPLYGRVCAMMTHTKINDEVRHKLQAEGANTATRIDGLQIAPNEKKSNHQKNTYRKIHHSLGIYKFLEKWV